MNLLQFFPFYQIIRQRGRQEVREGVRDGGRRENSVKFFLAESSLDTGSACLAPILKHCAQNKLWGWICMQRVLAKFSTFLKKLHWSNLRNKDIFCILKNTCLNNKVRQAGLADFWLQKDWASPDRVCQYLLTAVKPCSVCYPTQQRLKGEGELWICQYVPRKHICEL